jgi:hypothetical protein
MFNKINARLCINGKRNCSLEANYGVFLDHLYISCWNWKPEVNIILQKWKMEVNTYANKNGKKS